LLEQMKGETLSRLPADSRELGEFGNQLLDRIHRSERRGEGQWGHLAHLGLKHLGRAPLGLGHCREYQVAQELGIVILEYGGVDKDGTHRPAAVGGHLDHAPAGRGLNGAGCQLRLQLLQPALNLLTQLKELLKVCHAIG
jgi:hypothetical protein